MKNLNEDEETEQRRREERNTGERDSKGTKTVERKILVEDHGNRENGKIYIQGYTALVVGLGKEEVMTGKRKRGQEREGDMEKRLKGKMKEKRGGLEVATSI